MDTTPLSAIPLNVTRNVLDTGARLFLYRHSVESESGYTPVDTGDVNGAGEVYDNWLLDRNRFNEHILSICAIDPITTAMIEEADAIGYVGLSNLGANKCQIFEISRASFPRSNEDRIAELALQFVKVSKDFTPVGLGFPGRLPMRVGGPPA